MSLSLLLLVLLGLTIVGYHLGKSRAMAAASGPTAPLV